jgi:hypothetical protein
MLTCREVSRLVSQSMDARLPLTQRLGMRIHLLYCVWCRRYAAQLQFLRKATRELGNVSDDPNSPKLSEEAKEQMRARLRDAVPGPPPPPSPSEPSPPASLKLL